MDSIAVSAGISKAALYLQFDSKEAIFRAMVEALVTETLPQILPTDFADIPAADLLRRLIQAAMARMTTGEIAFVPRLIIGEGSNFPELVTLYHEQAITRIMSVVERLIAHGVARGEFRTVDTHHVTRSIIGGVVLTMIWKTVFEPAGITGFNAADMADAHIDVLLNGLRSPTRSDDMP